MEELARRAVACKGWRWMPGMLAVCTITLKNGDDRHGTMRVDSYSDGTPWALVAADKKWAWAAMRNARPVLTDPATLGCLLALVREAWKAPALQVSPWMDRDNAITGWSCYLNLPGSDLLTRDCYDGNTEAAALVAALEAANV